VLIRFIDFLLAHLFSIDCTYNSIFPLASNSIFIAPGFSCLALPIDNLFLMYTHFSSIAVRVCVLIISRLLFAAFELVSFFLYFLLNFQ